MTYKENIRAIIETCFACCKEELVDIAVDRIISLKQEPCEECVSRTEVMDMAGLYADWFESSDSYNDFVAELYNLPSVTPTTCIAKVTFDKDELQKIVDEKVKEMVVERKKGKWERGYSFPDGEYVKCTVCGEIIKCIYPMHFCPNCGAEMESKE